MNCPKCGTELVKKSYKGLFETDTCPNCRGMWLDFDELDRLEDTVFDQDERKGSLVHRPQTTKYRCPMCEGPLQEFQYRLYDLKLEYCAQNDHGFWLDAGEGGKIIEIMQRHAANNQRKLTSETEWRHFLKDMHAFIKKQP
jgi:Zn-finger nucleic acid-binding protein